MHTLSFKMLVLVALCGAVTLWCNCRSRSAINLMPDDELGYMFIPPQADLDTAFVGGRAASSVVELRNTSQNPLTLTTLEGDCPSGTTWSISTSTVGGRSSADLSLYFSPTQAYAEGYCVLSPRFEGYPAAGNTSLSIQFAAGEAACSLSPEGPFDFGLVEVGNSADQTLTISNTTSEDISANQFEYVFQNPSSGCGAFLLEEADSTGILGPDASKDIVVRFQPDGAGLFECQRELVSRSLAGMASHPTITNPCPSVVTWRAVATSGPEPVCSVSAPAPTFHFGEVQVGTPKALTLTMVNQTPDDIPANRFRFLLHSPVGDCDLFTLDPADTEGVIGPGETRDIPVQFAPQAAGTFQCKRSLSSLEVDEDLAITHACPTEIAWNGTGVAIPSQWSACQPTGTTNWQGIFGLSESEVYLVGDGESLFQSAGDCQWAQVGTIPSEVANVNFTDLWGHSDGTDRVIFAVGNIPPEPGFFSETGAIVKWDGTDWAVIDKDGLHTYASVWGSLPDNVYFGGAGVATDFPNAKHWDGNMLDPFQISDMGMSNVTALSGTGPNVVWAVLDQSSKSVFRFNGAQWEDMTPPFLTEPLNDLGLFITTLEVEVIVVGRNGAMYHYDGSNWEDVSVSGESRDLHAVWVSPDGRIFVVGEDRAIYLGHVNDPTGWTAMTPPPGDPNADFLDVWGPSDDVIYVTGTDGEVFRLTAGG